MIKKAVLFTIAVFGAMSCIGCESVVGPSTPEPTVTTYQGEWVGTTEQGLSVSFTVVGNTVTSFCVDYRYALDVVYSYSAAETATISEDHFNLTTKPPVPEGKPAIVQSIPVSGYFSSTNAAQGIVAFQPSLSWTAEKK